MEPIEIEQQRREIEVLKMCQHASIVKLIDLFETGEEYFVVMEHMKGGDLFDYMSNQGFKIQEAHAQKIILQLIQGVRYLHSFGIVHRDLKLENIMMSDSSDTAQPKIVDFGLSKMLQPNDTATEPFGTMGYIAPEVLLQKPYSFSCDVWSIGCIFYALLSGSLPFDSSSIREVKRMTVQEPVVFSEAAWASVSKESKDLVLQLLMKDQAERITLNEAVKHSCFAGIAKDKLFKKSMTL